MDKSILTLLFVSIISPVAVAGVIEFDPPSATVVSGDMVVFSVTVTSSGLAEFDAIDLLFSSDLADLGLFFEYDANLQTSFDPIDPINAGAFASDLLIGGANFDRWQAPVLLGQLTVDTTGVTEGSFSGAVQVRPDAEAALLNTPISAVTLGTSTEEITGSLDIVITDGETGGSGGGNDAGGGGDTGTDGSGDSGTDSGSTDGGSGTDDGGGDTGSDTGDTGSDSGGDSGTDGSGDDGSTTDGSSGDTGDAGADGGDGSSTDDGTGADDQDGTVTNDGGDTGSGSNGGTGGGGDGASDEGGGSNSASGAFCGMGMINATFMTLLMLFTTRRLRPRSSEPRP